MPKSFPLVTIPTKTLRQPSADVDPAIIGTPEFQTFLDVLTETMFVEDGVGIAAPQVGRNDRICIVNEKTGPKAYINPEVEITTDALQDSEEGCLSVPGVWGNVKRAKKIRFRALDRHGRKVNFEAKGFMATVYQHEVDHLNGVLFIDRAEKILRGEEKLK
ncbi:peptide deformylase [Patescibacteria group bacterium]|jgi:peptide deformylase|nr:peptide deformylase [Patescibacteria group bacterium]